MWNRMTDKEIRATPVLNARFKGIVRCDMQATGEESREYAVTKALETRTPQRLCHREYVVMLGTATPGSMATEKLPTTEWIDGAGIVTATLDPPHQAVGGQGRRQPQRTTTPSPSTKAKPGRRVIKVRPSKALYLAK